MSKLTVHPDDWAALSSEERNQIIGILANNGFIPKNQIEITDQAERLIPPGTDMGALTADTGVLGIGNWLCRRACDVAEATAVTACAALSNPIAVAACIALAHKGGDECRKRCG